jgi:5-methyltetrahydrofolate--homocysteine methyltransferase
VAEAERWLAPVLNYIPAQDNAAAERLITPATPIETPARARPANDLTAAEITAHPPGCNCAVHLAYRKKAARAG